MFVHGDNITQKISDTHKYNDKTANIFLKEIQEKYKAWKFANIDLCGPNAIYTDSDKNILQKRVALFNDYKDFIEQQKYAEKFDSRSNLHSTVLEEFLYFLFKDLVESFSAEALIGKSHAFKDIFFMPRNYKEMLSKPCVKIEKKDHDFVIGVNILTSIQPVGSSEIDKILIQVPAVAIECKTYLDKTMLEASSTAGEQLKIINPNALYIIVAEWLKLTENVNLKKYKIDQIYILRKQKNTDRENRFLPTYEKKPIYFDVICHLYETVRTHLSIDWGGGIASGLERGILI